MCDAARVHRLRLQRLQHEERHHHGARPVGNLVEVEREPRRQEHDLHRHGRHRAPRHLAVEREQRAREDVRARRAAAREDRLARAAACAARRSDRRSSSARNRPSRWRSCRSRRRGRAASRHARPGCGGDRRRSSLRARGLPARRGNGGRARIRTGWWRRPRARSTSGRRSFRSVEKRVGRGCDAPLDLVEPRRRRTCRALRTQTFAECQHVAFHAALRDGRSCRSGARQHRRRGEPGADRALDRRRQAACRSSRRRGPGCGSASRAAGRRAASRRRRGEGRPALAHDLPARAARRQGR